VRHVARHGKAPMHEWLGIGADVSGLDAAADRVRAAAAAAAANDAPGR